MVRARALPKPPPKHEHARQSKARRQVCWALPRAKTTRRKHHGPSFEGAAGPLKRSPAAPQACMDRDLEVWENPPSRCGIHVRIHTDSAQASAVHIACPAGRPPITKAGAGSSRGFGQRRRGRDVRLRICGVLLFFLVLSARRPWMLKTLVDPFLDIHEGSSVVRHGFLPPSCFGCVFCA